MDGNRFDSITKTLATAASRRAVVRIPGAIAAAMGLVHIGIEEAAAVCKNPGQKCDKNKDCCTKTCKGGRKGKKKKKGTCRCAKLRETCDNSIDCCGDGLGCHLPDPNGGASFLCCARTNDPCSSADDCCFENNCGYFIGTQGRCCRRDGFSCNDDGDCCSGHCNDNIFRVCD